MWDGSYNNVTDFYPRSPCGERPEGASARIRPVIISIHALLAESDPQTPDTLPGGAISIHALLAESDDGSKSSIEEVSFLSTLSLRRATLRKVPLLGIKYFYPRSPCGERRVRERITSRGNGNFYPRSPCGERRRGAVPVILII